MIIMSFAVIIPRPGFRYRAPQGTDAANRRGRAEYKTVEGVYRHLLFTAV